MINKLISLLLVIVFFCTGCTFEKDDLVVSDEKIVFANDVCAVEYFADIVLSDLQIVDSCLSFTIRNEGENKYNAGLSECLEYEVEGEWFQIKPLEMIDGIYVEIPAITYVVHGDVTFEKKCDLYYYGASKWKDGRYRISVPFSYDSDNSDNTWMQIQFAVSNGVPKLE